MAGLADIRIAPARDDTAPADTPREIVIPASVDKYRNPAPTPKAESKRFSLSSFIPSYMNGETDAVPAQPDAPRAPASTYETGDATGTGLGAQIMDVSVPTPSSVLEGRQIPVAQFDPQEAERLSNRQYAETTPAHGDVNDPRLRAPSLRQGGPQPQDMNALRGLAYSDSSMPVRMGAKMVSGLAEGVGGVARAAGDVTGINALRAAGQATAEGAKAFSDGMGETKSVDGFGPKSPMPYLANMAEGAGASLAQTAALGSLFGHAAVIPLMSIQSAGQKYNEARNAGKDPASALMNAVPHGVFEAVGEKFTGLDRVAGAMGSLLQKGASAEAKKTAAETLIRSGVREIPGEIITYLGQTGVDMLPGIGLNPNMTMAQFLDGLRDTVVQAGMMGGAMGVGGAAIQRKQRETAEQASMHATFRALAPEIGLPEKAISAAIEKTKGMDPERVPGFFDRFTQSLIAKGLLKPQAPGTVDRAVRNARDQAASALDALQAKPPQDQPVPADEVLGAVEPSAPADSGLPANQALENAAHSAATSPLNELAEPTDKQKAAGNYAMGHTRIAGMGVTIENPAGSTRRGTSPEGQPWESHMHDHYGYFKGTNAADGDKLDGFFKIGTPEDFAGNVYVVDQIDPATGKFDEHKVVVGATDEADAKSTYLRNYEPGWQGMGAITAMPMDQFKAWAKDGQKSQPLGQIKGAQDVGAAAQPNPMDTGAGGQLGANSDGSSPVRGPVPDGTGRGGRDAAGTAMAGGQQDSHVRAGQPERTDALRVGTTPKNAEPVSIKNGEIHIGKYPALDFETGEPVKVPEGASHAQIRDALKAAKALGTHQKLFGVVEDGQNPAPGNPAQAQAAPAEAPAPAGGQPDAASGIPAAGAAAPVEAARVAAMNMAGARQRSASYDKNPMMAFIAKHGLYHEKGKPNSLKSEFSPDKAIMVGGYAPVFRKTGKNLDLLTENAIEEGFLPEDGDERQLYELIRSAIGGKKIMPMYAQGVAEDEAERLFNERAELEQEYQESHNMDVGEAMPEADAERLAIQALSDLDDAEVFGLDEQIPFIGAPGNASEEQLMRALGFSEKEIQDAIAPKEGKPQEGGQSGTGPEQAAPGQTARAGGERVSQARTGVGATGSQSPRPAGGVSQESPPQTPADAGVSASGPEITRSAFDRGSATESAWRSSINERVGHWGVSIDPDNGRVVLIKGNDLVTFRFEKLNAEAESQAVNSAKEWARENKSLPNEVLSAPTRQDVIAQQDRQENAQALDDKEQIDKEAKLQTLTAQNAPEQRKDNTGDMFGEDKAKLEAAKREADAVAKNEAAKDPNQSGMFDDPFAVKDMELYIKVAADSIEDLRKTDVYRVLVESNRSEFRDDIAAYIKSKRPDLIPEVDAVMAEEEQARAEKAREEKARKDAKKSKPLESITPADAKGKMVTYEVEIADSGDTAKVTVDAGSELEDYDKRINAMRKLLECLK